MNNFCEYVFPKLILLNAEPCIHVLWIVFDIKFPHHFSDTNLRNDVISDTYWHFYVFLTRNDPNAIRIFHSRFFEYVTDLRLEFEKYCWKWRKMFICNEKLLWICVSEINYFECGTMYTCPVNSLWRQIPKSFFGQ